MMGIATLIVALMAGLLGAGAGLLVGTSGGGAAIAVAVGLLVAVPAAASGGASGLRHGGAASAGVAVAVHLVIGGDATFLPVAGAVVLGLVVRALVASSMLDVRLAAQISDHPPGSAPTDRVRTRVIALGVVLSALAAAAEVTPATFADLERPASGRPLLVVVAWFVLGLVAVGALHLRAQRWRWGRDEFEVDERLTVHWTAAVAVAAAVTSMVALALPAITSRATSLPARAIGEVGGLGRWLSERIEALGSLGGDSESAEDASSRGAEPPASPFEDVSGEPPEWLGDVAFLAMSAAVIWLVVRVASGARLRAPSAPGAGPGLAMWRFLVSLVAEVRALLRSLWRLLGRVEARAGAGEGTDRRDTDSDSPSVWSPVDSARRRVGVAFGRIAALVAPFPGETPREVADDVARRADAGSVGTVLDAYLEARYSRHPIDEELARRAEESSDRVVRDVGRHRPESGER